VAATLVGLWLAAGERCLWTLVALTSRRLAGLVRPVLPVTVAVDSRRSYVVDRTPALPRRLWATRHVCRRGPPLLAA